MKLSCHAGPLKKMQLTDILISEKNVSTSNTRQEIKKRVDYGLGGFDPWKIVENNNNFLESRRCPPHAQSLMNQRFIYCHVFL
jgi:hypothetical protein